MSSASLTLEEFVSAFPETEYVDILMSDCNGQWRGKQIPASGAAKVGTLGMPYNTTIMATIGEVSDAIVEDIGSEPDRPVRMIPGTVAPVPWAARPTVQVVVDIEDGEGQLLPVSPRAVLQHILDHYTKDGLRPVCAVELEFTLFKLGSMPPEPAAPLNGQVRIDDPQCYNMDLMADYQQFLYDVQGAARRQGISLTTFVKEEGVAQFEVNTGHSSDVLAVADEAMLLKRLIRGVAQQHGMHASFMAKPRTDHAGNGQHIHLSMQRVDGSPVFTSIEPDSALAHAVCGMMDHMDPGMVFFAPNANSYRRFDRIFFAPTAKFWAVNNRYASVRIPASDAANLRIEHRIAGADASPHLVLAAVLAAAYAGLKAGRSPGSAYGEFDAVPETAERIPTRWSAALEALKQADQFRALFNQHFMSLIEKVRAGEEEDFHMQVTPLEYSQLYRVL